MARAWTSAKPSMTEETVYLLQKEQTDDDNKTTYCLTSIDRAVDEGKSLTIDLKGHKGMKVFFCRW